MFPGKLSTIQGRAKILMDWKSAGDFLIFEPRFVRDPIKVHSSARYRRVSGPLSELPHIKKVAVLEGKRELAQKFIDGAAVERSKLNSAPDTVRAVREEKADAGVVYYSAAGGPGNPQGERPRRNQMRYLQGPIVQLF